MELSKIKKGKPKDPGELAGVVYFGNKSHLGTLDGNSDNGIFGTLDDEEWDENQSFYYGSNNNATSLDDDSYIVRIY